MPSQVNPLVANWQVQPVPQLRGLKHPAQVV